MEGMNGAEMQKFRMVSQETISRRGRQGTF